MNPIKIKHFLALPERYTLNAERSSTEESAEIKVLLF
jgi:hypothetical protein